MNVIRVLFAPLLAIFSFAYAGVMLVRAWCYRAGVIPSGSSGAFVISIGNIQAGGTGKTPIVDFFARRWRDKIRVGIVSRGYGRTTKGSMRVQPTAAHAADEFGDEATWLATSLSEAPTVPVQVGEKRVRASQDLVASEGVTAILLDDGFQHLALRRSFDIVLIDVSAPRWQWRVIPWGRLREPVSGLRRADTVILTKTESADESRLIEFEKQVLRWAGSERTSYRGVSMKLPVLRFRQKLSWPNPTTEPMVAAAGLARPEAFFAMVKAHETKPRIVAEVPFADHHRFTIQDVVELKRLAATRGSKRVLVTEKDAVKLSKIWSTVDAGPLSQIVELVVSKLDVFPARESDEVQLERVDEIILGEVRRSVRPGAKPADSKLAT